jgi:CRISPR-associated protein Cmr3
MTDYLFIRPVDVLFFRGNRLFSDAGHGDALMPPWPSVFSGALRSRILVDRGASFDAFNAGAMKDPELERVIGRSPDEPGTFRVRGIAVAGRAKESESLRLLFPMPADWSSARGAAGQAQLVHLEPRSLAEYGIATSSALPSLPVLRMKQTQKTLSGQWVTARALERDLAREAVHPDDVIPSSRLWRTDHRLGIALSPERRTAENGMLYTADAIAMAPGAGFVVAVEGAGSLLPTTGLIRLGGDGHGATVERWPSASDDGWPRFTSGKQRFRMVLATPGIFPEGGWCPPGVARDEAGFVLSVRGLRARLVSAAVSRSEVISGWDLATRAPKPARRATPAGSVYWFEVEEGNTDELRHLYDEGLWPLLGDLDRDLRARRAEGFNSVWFGDWH